VEYIGGVHWWSTLVEYIGGIHIGGVHWWSTLVEYIGGIHIGGIGIYWWSTLVEYITYMLPSHHILYPLSFSLWFGVEDSLVEDSSVFHLVFHHSDSKTLPVK
jgi:hypothetical protein